jgi:hypothetical protein
VHPGQGHKKDPLQPSHKEYLIKGKINRIIAEIIKIILGQFRSLQPFSPLLSGNERDIRISTLRKVFTERILLYIQKNHLGPVTNRLLLFP